MALTCEKDSKVSGLCKLAIDKEMTIYEIDALKQGLSETIESYEQFELNLAAVEEIDTSGIQLLLALTNELKRIKKPFILTEVSSTVAKLIESYGVDDRLIIGEAA